MIRVPSPDSSTDSMAVLFAAYLYKQSIYFPTLSTLLRCERLCTATKVEICYF